MSGEKETWYEMQTMRHAGQADQEDEVEERLLYAEVRAQVVLGEVMM